MKRIPALVLLLGVMALSVPAQALTLSGQYAFLSSKICQASLPVTVAVSGNSASGFSASLNQGSPGSIHGVIGILKFNPTTKTVTGAGIESKGSLLVVTDNYTGDVTSPANATLSGPFSVTALTVTFGGKTYAALFGGVVNGVANQVEIMNSTADCIETGYLNRQ